MTRFITLTAMIAMLAALWLAAAAVVPSRTQIESARRIAQPDKMVALTRNFHSAVFRTACENLEPTMKIFQPDVDWRIARSTSPCRHPASTMPGSLQEQAR